MGRNFEFVVSAQKTLFLKIDLESGKKFLLDREYKTGEKEGQFDRVRGLNQNTLLS